MTIHKGTTVELVCSVVKSLGRTEEISLTALCDRVLKEGESLGWPRLERSSVLTTIRRSIVNRHGSHYDRRAEKQYNPAVDLLWEYEPNLLVGFDPERHLRAEGTLNQQDTLPHGIRQTRGRQLHWDYPLTDALEVPSSDRRTPSEPPKTDGRPVLPAGNAAVSSASRKMPQRNSPAPILIEPAGSQASKRTRSPRKKLANHFNGGISNNFINFEIKWRGAIPVPASPWTCKVVQLLAYHEGISVLGPIPFGLRSSSWQIDAVLADPKGSLVLMIEAWSVDLGLAGTVREARLWGLSQGDKYSGVRVIVVMCNSDTSLKLWTLAEEEHLNLYNLQMEVTRTLPSLGDNSGGK